MTNRVKQAFDDASKLPEELQDQLAGEWLEDLNGEKAWDSALAASQSTLEEMAEEALEEHQAGKTLPMGMDEL